MIEYQNKSPGVPMATNLFLPPVKMAAGGKTSKNTNFLNNDPIMTYDSSKYPLLLGKVVHPLG